MAWETVKEIESAFTSFQVHPFKQHYKLKSYNEFCHGWGFSLKQQYYI